MKKTVFLSAPSCETIAYNRIVTASRARGAAAATATTTSTWGFGAPDAGFPRQRRRRDPLRAPSHLPPRTRGRPPPWRLARARRPTWPRPPAPGHPPRRARRLRARRLGLATGRRTDLTRLPWSLYPPPPPPSPPPVTTSTAAAVGTNHAEMYAHV